MDLEKDIKKIKKEALDTIHKSMDSSGAGGLKEQISIDITKNGFTILATDAVVFANSGRKPGKMPYSEWLKPWAEKRSIPLTALYPIARKIGQDGTKGKFFLNVLDKVFENAEEKLANTLENYVAKEIKEKQ